MIIGAHFSIANGITNAIKIAEQVDVQAIQIFISNPRAWKFPMISDESIEKFNNVFEKSKIKKIVVHMPYLPNFATQDKTVYHKSIKIFKSVLDICAKLKADYLVTHPGHALYTEPKKSLRLVANAINIVLSNSVSNVSVLIENTAGQGSEVGFTFGQLKEIIEQVKNKKRIGVCLDTAHAFAAGYDLNSKKNINKVFKEFDDFIGFDKLKVIHLNDTLIGCAKNIDRHYYLGEGKIGLDSFKYIINFSKFEKVVGILETPEKENKYHINCIKKIRNFKV